MKIKAFIIFGLAIVILGSIIFFFGQKKPAIVEMEKLIFSEIIPGITTRSDVESLLAKDNAAQIGEWTLYSGDQFPDTGIRNIYIHYDAESNKIDLLQFALKPNVLIGSEAKKIYSLEGISPETVVVHNRLFTIYALENSLMFVITYSGPTDQMPIYNLTYLTLGAFENGLLFKVPGYRTEINGEWVYTSDSGNFLMHIFQDRESFSGVYGHEKGIIYGTIKDREAQGTWKQEGNKRGGQTQLTVSEDGKTLSGSWQYDPAIYNSGMTGGGAWTFQRKE